MQVLTVRLMLSDDPEANVGLQLQAIENVTTQLRTAELARAVAVAGVADDYAIPADVLSLQCLIDHTTAREAACFRAHREALVHLAREIEQISEQSTHITANAH